MARRNVQQRTKSTSVAVAHETPVTRQVEFNHIPVDGVHLMAVLPGVDEMWAISEADCIDAGVRRLMSDATGEGIHGDVAWLCEFALSAARALRESAGIVS